MIDMPPTSADRHISNARTRPLVFSCSAMMVSHFTFIRFSISCIISLMVYTSDIRYLAARGSLVIDRRKMSAIMLTTPTYAIASSSVRTATMIDTIASATALSTVFDLRACVMSVISYIIPWVRVGLANEQLEAVTNQEVIECADF